MRWLVRSHLCPAPQGALRTQPPEENSCSRSSSTQWCRGGGGSGLGHRQLLTLSDTSLCNMDMFPCLSILNKWSDKERGKLSGPRSCSVLTSWETHIPCKRESSQVLPTTCSILTNIVGTVLQLLTPNTNLIAKS